MAKLVKLCVILLLTIEVLFCATFFFGQVSAANGVLSVSCGQPNVQIYVDTVLVGTTDANGNGPASPANSIAPGTHTLKLTKVGFNDWSKQFSITDSQTTTVYAYLESGSGVSTTRTEVISPASTGRLSVSIGVSGLTSVSIYIDGEYSGLTGSTVNGLNDGVHTLKLSKMGYKDWSKSVNITQGQTTTVYAYPETGSGASTTRTEVPAYNSVSVYGSLRVLPGQSIVDVYVGGEYEGTASSSDYTANGILPGDYTLRLSKVGYKDWTKQIRITASTTTTVYASLEAGSGLSTTRNEIILPGSSFGVLSVSTGSTTGVSVYVNGEYGGDTSTGGSRTVNGLMGGTYNLMLSKSGYRNWTKNIIIGASGQTTTVQAAIEAGSGNSTTRNETISYNTAYGSLRIVSDQTSANAYWGGEYCGTTTTDSTFSNIIQGTYTLQVSKTGFKSWTKQVTITSGQTTIVYVSEEPGTGVSSTRSETISYVSPVGVLIVKTGLDAVPIYVGGEFGGNTSSGQRQVNGIPQGTYTLTISKAGYKDYSKNVIITVGQTTTICVSLEPGTGTATVRSETLSYNSPVGSLLVNSNYDGVNVYVAGEYGGNTSSYYLTRQVDGLIAGTYTVKCTRAGCLDYSTSATITVGSTTSITVNMQPIAPTASFTYDNSNLNEWVSIPFTDTSTGIVTSWLWSFGDGVSSTSTYQNPTHAYAAAGTYTVTLTAINSAGNNTTTKQITIVGPTPTPTVTTPPDTSTNTPTPTPVPVPPKPVTLGTPTGVTGNHLTLNWAPASNSNFQKYDIFRSSSEGYLGSYVDSITSQSTTTYYVDNLSPGTTYYFTVRTVSTDSNYADSNQISITTPGGGLRAVTVSVSSVSTNSVTLTFSQTYSDNFSKRDVFMSRSYNQLGDYIGSITSESTTTFLATGLSAQTTYYFTVRTVNINGEYIDSNQVYATTGQDMSVILIGGVGFTFLVFGAISLKVWSDMKRKEGIKQVAKAKDWLNKRKHVDAAECYSKACLANIRNKTQPAVISAFEQYYSLARAMIIQTMLMNKDQSVIERMNRTQTALMKAFVNKKNKKIVRAYDVDRLKEINTLITKANANDLDAIVDEAINEGQFEEKFLQEIRRLNQVSLSDLAVRLGFNPTATRLLLLKNIQQARISGYITDNQENYMSKENLMDELSKRLE
jgi:PKD repeat protein